ncbi:TATE DNA Transposon [Trypanosoma theileri]|uniref:TATE DNA Transposon n=1 Tax=Trypanosoma theileri TaxID=67003 RepID=A0A1X0P392_9TRYP|nr:TATE DNA Transposon [Trypanosoma theileri]ORC91163.1 TATE DNA Transposon [Trypanosoma theileri]
MRGDNPQSALPSLREGATRHLAAQRMSEEHRMTTTWHTRIDTLRRYLGNHLQMTREAEHTRDNDVRALLRAEFPGNTAPRTREHGPKSLSSKHSSLFASQQRDNKTSTAVTTPACNILHRPLHLKDATPSSTSRPSEDCPQRIRLPETSWSVRYVVWRPTFFRRFTHIPNHQEDTSHDDGHTESSRDEKRFERVPNGFGLQYS